jgi:hypothetical protein
MSIIFLAFIYRERESERERERRNLEVITRDTTLRTVVEKTVSSV